MADYNQYNNSYGGQYSQQYGNPQQYQQAQQFQSQYSGTYQSQSYGQNGYQSSGYQTPGYNGGSSYRSQSYGGNYNNPYSSGVYNPQQPASAGGYNTGVNVAAVTPLRTNRGLLKTILLSIVTFGIYPIVMYSHMSEEINLIASPYDGKRTPHYLIGLLLGLLTFGIYLLVWVYQFNERISNELVRRRIPNNFTVTDFWLWNVVLMLLFGVGSLVYTYKLLHAFDDLCVSYNTTGC